METGIAGVVSVAAVVAVVVIVVVRFNFQMMKKNL